MNLSDIVHDGELALLLQRLQTILPEVSKTVFVHAQKEMIHFDKLPSGQWRATWVKADA